MYIATCSEEDTVDPIGLKWSRVSAPPFHGTEYKYGIDLNLLAYKDEASFPCF